MKQFEAFRSRAIPMDLINIDTDQIIPKQFLKLVQKTGYDKYLFYDWRFDKDGKPRGGFVLNDPKYRGRSILLVRDNFGSGSSREHAVWALRDFGIKVILAPSFADIFHNNCFKNGVLPIILKQDAIEYLFKGAETTEINVDLGNQCVVFDTYNLHFDIMESNKRILLEGLDEIGMTLQLESYISNFEKMNTTYVL